MKPISFLYKDSARVSHEALAHHIDRLVPEHERIAAALGTGYETAYAALNVCTDTALIERVETLAHKKLVHGLDVIVVIGIGGSSLGTRAIHQALNGTLYNDVTTGPKVYFVESVDSDYTASVVEIVRQVVQRNGRVLVNIVTKSGTTTETLANAHVFIALLQQWYGDEYAQHLVVTTDTGSKLHTIAQHHGIDVLEIPPRVGGRYSALSAVGLFPCALLGIDIRELHRGASLINQEIVSQPLEATMPAVSAAVKYIHYNDNGINIDDMFVFSSDCAGLGQWYRQLMGESIGKLHNRQGERVEVGITPTVSVGTTDLHSVGQLYLGGPRDKFITFVRVGKSVTQLTVPVLDGYDAVVEHIQGKTFDDIMAATLDGVLAAYVHEQRPYDVVEIPEVTACSIGQFIQMYMLEMIYLGYLLDVDPFDQPQVELYKQETRKILAHE